MRQGTAIIGGREVAIRSLSVGQTMDIDTEMADAIGTKDVKARSRLRAMRVALALQNADAFIPDPANPKGEIGAKSIPMEKLIEIIRGDQLFLDSDEYYEAETAVIRLIRKEEPKPKSGEGESPAAS